MLLNETFERTARQEAFNNGIELFPEVMREAGGPAEAGTFTAALRCVHVLVYSQNNAIDGDLRSRLGKLVTA